MVNKFMARAIELAQKYQGLTSPNPCVGAVIVKGGHIVAEGAHVRAGEDHAEIVAMKALMAKSGVSVDFDPNLFSNATLYVTLEPCAHNGKTPSCAKAIAAAGFKKVVVGMKDPFSKVNGKGVLIMKKAEIDVEVLKDDADVRELNQSFVKWVETGLPYVVLKAGMSLDGKIATSGGESKWITSEKARKDGRIERSKCDAVLVGIGTVLADDPELAAHGKFKNKSLLRIVLDSKLQISLDSQVLRDGNVLIVCSNKSSKSKIAKLKKMGVGVKTFAGDKISVKALLKHLGKKGVQSVFVEGGSSVHGAFYDSGDVDKVIFYVAPKIFGGEKSLSVVGGEGMSKLKDVSELKDLKFETLGSDLKLSGVFNLF